MTTKMTDHTNEKEQIIAEIRAKSFASSIPGSLTRYVSMRDVERIFAEHDIPPGGSDA